MPAYQLVVKHVFANYQVGDHITDPALVAKYGASHPAETVRKLLEESPSSSPISTASPTVPQLSSIS